MKSFGLIRKLAVGFTLGVAMAAAPVVANAGVFISVGFAPPALPVYTQPICPGDGYLWNPGYWAYGPEGYYWVPGVWVQPPTVGVLWTPGYWGWGGSAFIFHEGYWGPHVAFYGGINYGFGYTGSGFYGGRWDGGHFAYNTAVLNVNRTVIHNTYVENVHVNNTTYTHTSFNGGNGGVPARPSSQEAQFEHERHISATSAQMSHIQAAHAVPGNFAKANGGHPQMAALQRPGAMNTAVPARGGFGNTAVNQRAANQQARVGQGLQSGQMNARETQNVEGREASINRQTANDRAANGGRLTPQAHQQINQRQNNVSQSINQDKHNAAVQPRAQAQARPQAQPRPQAAPRAAGHPEGGHPHR